MLCVIISAILFTLVFVYYKLLKPIRYWEEKDVPHVKAWPVFGSLKEVILKKKHLTEVLNDIYYQYPTERCVGYMQFTKPFLMIKDLELIKKITVKDFEHFHDHLAFENLKSDPLLSKSIMSLSGENWRRMRATLSPVFTSSKMRIIYDLMTECAKNFVKHFKTKDAKSIEMKDVFSRFANDVIATTAFGVSIDSLNDPNNEFFKMGGNFTSFSISTIVKIFFMQTTPWLANFLQLQLFAENVSMFFRNLIKDNIKKRESEGIVRPDLIHLLMQARKGHLKHDNDFPSLAEEIKNSSPLELSDDDIVAQALAFFLAGFETVSTASSFIAHEVALHPEVQKKLQLEIDGVSRKYNGKVPYEALQAMQYLDQVVSETLRLWPPGFQTDRLCVKDYVIEPKNPKEKVVFVAKGSSVMIPIFSLHRDPQYFDNPDRFDPERFSEENKLRIIPGTYLPFGIGPRNCIGLRFALLEMKILFFHLLSNFIIVPVEETAIPLRISPKRLNFAPENGFRLGLKPRIFK